MILDEDRNNYIDTVKTEVNFKKPFWPCVIAYRKRWVASFVSREATLAGILCVRMNYLCTRTGVKRCM